MHKFEKRGEIIAGLAAFNIALLPSEYELLLTKMSAAANPDFVINVAARRENKFRKEAYEMTELR